MKTALVSFFIFVIGLSVLMNAAPQDDAMSSALAWLKLVDSGKYIESDKQAAALFQKAASPEKWEMQLNVGRAPLGKLISRAEKSRKHATTLPGAPDGDYYLIQFNTAFEKKTEAVETVTMMREADGQWRVA